MPLHRINLLLLGLVALLGLAALLPKRDAPRPLTPLHPDTVQHIRVADRQGLRLELNRDATGWRMTRPRAAPADRERAEALAAIAAAPVYRSFPAGEADPAALGLAPPFLHLELDGQVLEIGGTEPVNRRRYVRSGERLHLVDDRFLHLLLAPADSFTAKQAP